MKKIVIKEFKTLKEHEKETRRDVIKNAAERVFAKKPFDEVTIRDVAREAGISHSLIYRYFPDQQSLFVEACFRGRRENRRVHQQAHRREQGHQHSEGHQALFAVPHRQ